MVVRKKVCIMAGIFAFILAGCSEKSAAVSLSGIYSDTAKQDSTISAFEDETDEDGGLTENGICYVFVCGAVVKPGVYELPYGSRIYEAVALAGGITDDGAYMAVNLVEPVSDGQQIFIPTNEEYEEKQEEIYQSESGLVDLNTAGKQELMTLTGIGESKAEAILAYRSEHGGFSSIEELMQVPGIKEAAFEKIRDYITVN